METKRISLQLTLYSSPVRICAARFVVCGVLDATAVLLTPHLMPRLPVLLNRMRKLHAHTLNSTLQVRTVRRTEVPRAVRV